MTLMVLDGNSIVNRAFYGIRALNAPDGTPTNGIYGFVAILQKLLDEQRPEALCVAFDLPAPTFRHEQFEGYKAQRKAMPEDLAVQMPLLKEFLDAMGIRRYELAGFEADDLIGTVSRLCAEDGVDCVVVTGDKDSFQLIGEHVSVRHVKSRMGQTETIVYDRDRFFEEYGFEPPRMVDLKALMGDASDNIPGVPGVGEKTALDLIRRFGSLDGVYENLDSPDIKEGVRKKLAAGEESARKSYYLATICTDVAMDFKPEDTVFKAEYGSALYGICKRLGFLRFIEKWGLIPEISLDAIGTPQKEAGPSEQTASDKAGWDALIAKLRGADFAAVYVDRPERLEITEGTGLWTVTGDLSDGDYRAFLEELFSDTINKVSENVKDLMHQLLKLKLPAEGFLFDTALAGYLLSATDAGYDAAALGQKYLGAPRSGAMGLYALYPALDKALGELGMLSKLYYEVELPLCAVLAQMELAGFAVDKDALESFGQSLARDSEALQREIWDLAGEAFNINSPKQLGDLLFGKLGLPSGKKTKTGYSTDVDVLERLRFDNPIVDKILQYRQLTKLKSTYADGLLKVISPEDGRIHTNFQMTVTATGRLSSTEPNLQNIPVRTALGAEFRKMFVAGPGLILADADYSQIELRLLAHISGDETMKNAFQKGEDIHTVTASQVFGVPVEEVTPLMRSRAKAVNFGIVYGISAFSLAQDIGVFQSEARAYMDAYLSKYHGVRRYMKDVVAKAREDGYVETLFGRRRALPELKSSNYNVRSFGERVALNMPIQGTAADVIKLAMVRVHRRFEVEGLKARLILQVHDELIAECPPEEAETVKVILAQEMQSAVSYSVPLTAEAKTGHSWHDTK